MHLDHQIHLAQFILNGLKVVSFLSPGVIVNGRGPLVYYSTIGSEKKNDDGPWL